MVSTHSCVEAIVPPVNMSSFSYCSSSSSSSSYSGSGAPASYERPGDILTAFGCSELAQPYKPSTSFDVCAHLLPAVVRTCALVWSASPDAPSPRRCLRWELIPDMHEMRVNTSATVVGDQIYTTGGVHVIDRVLGRTLQSVERYDSRTRRWARLPDMCDARCWHGSVGFRGRLYVFGGTRDSYFATRCEVYSVLDNTWRE